MTDKSKSKGKNSQSSKGKDESNPTSSTSSKLASGLLSIYQPSLEDVKKELNDLTNKQDMLLNQMQIENQEMSDNFDSLGSMFATMKLYRERLTTIKRDMISIHERTSKLKKRAVRLQQIKQKEALDKEQQREQELRREQELIGKPAKDKK